jgi:hypothetical protein
MRSETFVSSERPFDVIGLLVLPLGNHGSDHILTEFPPLIFQIIPSLKKSSPCRILRYEYETPAQTLQCRILLFGKYLAFKTRPHNVSGHVNNLHACLANIAWLNKYKSLNPNPPFFFDLVSFSQLNQ